MPNPSDLDLEVGDVIRIDNEYQRVIAKLSDVDNKYHFAQAELTELSVPIMASRVYPDGARIIVLSRDGFALTTQAEYFYHATGRPVQADGGLIVFGRLADDWFELIPTEILSAGIFGVLPTATAAENLVAMQAALNAADTLDVVNVVKVPPGEYDIECSLTDRLNIPAGVKLVISGCTFNQTVKPGHTAYQFMRLSYARSQIEGPATINLDRSTGALAGENSTGIYISAGAKDCLVSNLDINSSHADAIYIAANKTESANIVVQDVNIDNCRRNGISITQGYGILIERCNISNTIGTAPEEGIDIEPNVGDTVRDVVIRDVSLSNNRGGGIVARSGAAGRDANGNAATSRVRLERIDLAGQVGGQAVGFQMVDDCTMSQIINGRLGLISIEHSRRVSVTGCRTAGLYLAGCSNSLIENNTFDGLREAVTFEANADVFSCPSFTPPVGAPVQLALDTGGAFMPNFTSATTYYVVNATETTFQLSATLGGAPITSTGNGSGLLLVGFAEAGSVRLQALTVSPNQRNRILNNTIVNARGCGVEDLNGVENIIRFNDIGRSALSGIRGLYLHKCTIEENWIHGVGKWESCILFQSCLNSTVRGNILEHSYVLGRFQVGAAATTTVLPLQQLGQGSDDFYNGLTAHVLGQERAVSDYTQSQVTLASALSAAPPQYTDFIISDTPSSLWSQYGIRVNADTRHCTIAENDLAYAAATDGNKLYQILHPSNSFYNNTGVTFNQPEGAKEIEVETVADLQAYRGLVNGQLVRTRSYATAGDQGGAVYRYFATGRSLQTIDGLLKLNLSGDDDFVQLQHAGVLSVALGGAVGGGVVDDTVAIQKVLDAAGDLVTLDGSGYVSEQIVVEVPPAGTYKITDTLFVPIGVSFICRDQIVLDGPAARPAVVIGEEEQRNYNVDIVLNLARTNGPGSFNEADVGVEIRAAYDSIIELRNSVGFGTHLRMKGGDGIGCVYNNVKLGAVRGGFIGVDLQAGSGWCNQNTFTGGSWRGCRTGIRASALAITAMDNNLFIAPSFELSPPAATTSYALELNNGTGIRITDARCENGGAGTFKVARFTGDSRNNRVHIAAGGSATRAFDDESVRKTNFVEVGTLPWGDLGRQLFHLDGLAAKAIEYSAGNIHVPGLLASAITSTQGGKSFSSITVGSDGITLPSTRGLGRLVDTSVCKKFVVQAQSDSNVTYWVRSFDAAGALLTPGSPSSSDVYAYFPGAFNDGNVRRSSPTQDSLCVTVAESVKSVEIYAAECTNLQSFSIYAIDVAKSAASSAVRYVEPIPGAPSASGPPTGGSYKRGQVIFNDEPSAGEPFAWVCTADGSPGTWVPAGTAGNIDVYDFDTLTDALASVDLVDGQPVRTQGHSAVADGGGQLLYYRATGWAASSLVEGPFHHRVGVTDAYLEAIDQSVARPEYMGATGGAGVDYTSVIQACIDTGKDVLFTGSYGIGLGLTVSTPGQKLYGTGLLAVVVAASPGPTAMLTLDGTATAAVVEGLEFKGFIQQAWWNANLGDVPTTVDGYYKGVFLRGQSQVVRNCRFSRLQNGAFIRLGAATGVIEGCTFDGFFTETPMGYANHNMAFGGAAPDCRYTSNHAHDCGALVTLAAGASGCVIADNTAETLYDNGIYCSTSNHTTITGNCIKDVSGNSGIKARGHNYAITGNTVVNALVGIQATPNTGSVSANWGNTTLRFTNGSKHPQIGETLTQGAVTGVVRAYHYTSGNSALGSISGWIEVSTATGGWVAGTVNGSAGGAAMLTLQIQSLGGYGNTISGNTVRGATSIGIAAVKDDAFWQSGVSIVGNTITDSGGDGLAAIRIEAHNVVVSGNVVTGYSSPNLLGALQSLGGTNIKFLDNIVTGSSAAGLYFTGESPGMVIEGNTITATSAISGGSADCVYRNNTLNGGFNTSWPGRFTFAGNTLNGKFFVNASNSSAEVAGYLTVTGNKIACPGVAFEHSSATLNFQRVEISGNRFESLASSPSYAFYWRLNGMLNQTIDEFRFESNEVIGYSSSAGVTPFRLDQGGNSITLNRAYFSGCKFLGIRGSVTLLAADAGILRMTDCQLQQTRLNLGDSLGQITGFKRQVYRGCDFGRNGATSNVMGSLVFDPAGEIEFESCVFEGIQTPIATNSTTNVYWGRNKIIGGGQLDVTAISGEVIRETGKLIGSTSDRTTFGATLATGDAYLYEWQDTTEGRKYTWNGTAWVAEVAVAAEYPNLAAALAATMLEDGQTLATQGYLAAGDGGGNQYIYHASGWSALVSPDGVGFYIRVGLTDAYLEAKNKTTAFVDQFGAVGNGVVDDGNAIRSAVATAKTVKLSRKSYRITSVINLADGQSIIGDNGGSEIFYDAPADYDSAINAADDTFIEGIIFRGTNTAKAVSGSTYQGAAVGITNIANVVVKNCQFYEFVFSATNTSVIAAINSRNVTVEGCFFDASCVSGQMIALGARVRDSKVKDNQCYANCDLFLGLSSIGSAVAGSELWDSDHHVVTGNIVIFNDGLPNSAAREGLNLHYDGGRTFATIANNVFVNANRHGIYLRGDSTVGGETGPTTITGNIIRYCGGANGESTNYTVNSGIKIESTLGAIVTGNIIEKCGYHPDGTTRTHMSAAIEVARAGRQLVISGNVIRDSYGFGIMMSPTVGLTTGTFHIEQCVITGNTVSGCSVTSIVYGQNASPTVLHLAPVTITNNSVTLPAGAPYGIGVANPTATDDVNCVISGNVVRGFDNTQGAGIAISNAKVTGQVFGNDLSNLLYGIRFANVNGSGIMTGYVAHKYLGENVWVHGNTFSDLNTPVSCGATGVRAVSLVADDNILKNTTGTFRGDAYYGYAVAGRKNGNNSLGQPLFTFFMDATPIASGGTYRVGDRISIRSPGVGVPAGYVCTVAGDPGTWAPLDSPLLNEPDFATNSTTLGATQASIKSYVDGKASQSVPFPSLIAAKSSPNLFDGGTVLTQGYAASADNGGSAYVYRLTGRPDSVVRVTFSSYVTGHTYTVSYRGVDASYEAGANTEDDVVNGLAVAIAFAIPELEATNEVAAGLTIKPAAGEEETGVYVTASATTGTASVIVDSVGVGPCLRPSGNAADDYFELFDKQRVTVTNCVADYVYPNTGTDNAPLLQAALDEAWLQSSVSGRAVVVTLPPGQYRTLSQVTVPPGVVLAAYGVTLQYRGNWTSGRSILRIDGGGNHILPGVVGSSTASAARPNGKAYFPADELDFAGVHLAGSIGNSDIQFNTAGLVPIGVKLHPTVGTYCGYNRFSGGNFYACRTAVELRGSVGSRWVNENSFYGMNCSATSSGQETVSAYGVKFSADNGGYRSQNNNRFYSTCFQMQTLNTSYSLTLGKAVGLNRRYYNPTTKNEYILTTLGDGTVDAVPTHTSGEVLDAGGNGFTYVGPARRCPVYHDNAGNSNTFYSCRWETGEGAFALIEADYITDNLKQVLSNEYHTQGPIGVVDPYPAIDYVSLAKNVQYQFAYNNRLTFYGAVGNDDGGDEVINIDALHKRVLASAEGTCVKGMAYFKPASNEISRYTDAKRVKLGLRDARLWGDSGYENLGVAIDVRERKVVHVYKRTNDAAVAGRVAATGMNADFNFAGPTSVNDKKFVSTSAWSDITKSTSPGSDTASLGVAAADASVRYLFCGLSQSTANVSDIVISVPSLGRFNLVSAVTPWSTDPNVGSRYCYGRPIIGHFDVQGEFIENIKTGGLEPVGWRVTRAGHLADAWAASQVIDFIGELRAHNGRIYAAVAAGTTGVTPPTHTSGTVSDGSVSWTYVGLEATLAVESVEIETEVELTSAAISLSQSFVDGQIVKTAAYYTPGDQGGGRFTYHQTGRSGVTPDAGSIIAGSGADDYFSLIPGDVIYDSSFGVVSTGDMQTRLQAAINYAVAQDLKLVLTVDSSHSSTLTIAGAITMEGQGRHKVLAVTTATNNMVVSVSNGTVVNLRNLVLSGGITGLTITGGYLNRHSKLENIQAQTCTIGFFVQAGVIGCHFKKWTTETVSTGFLFQGSDIANGAILESFRVAGATVSGMNLNCTAAAGGGDFNGVSVVNLIAENNSGVGVSLNSVGVTFISPWFESNGTDLEIDTNYNGVTVTRASVLLLHPHFSTALSEDRVKLLDSGISLRVIGGSGAAGGNNFINGFNNSAASSIDLFSPILTVKNFPEHKVSRQQALLTSSARLLINNYPTVTPGDPEPGQVTVWNDDTGNLQMKYNLSGTVKQAKLASHAVLGGTVFKAIPQPANPSSNEAYLYYSSADGKYYLLSNFNGLVRRRMLFATVYEQYRLRAAYAFDAAESVFSDAGVTPAVDGGTVYRWGTFDQTSATQRPTYRVNGIGGKPAIEFDGVDNQLTSTLGSGEWVGLHNGTGGTLLAVVEVANSMDNRLGTILGTGGTTLGTSILFDDRSASSRVNQLLVDSYRQASQKWVSYLGAQNSLVPSEPNILAIRLLDAGAPEMIGICQDNSFSANRVAASFPNFPTTTMILGYNAGYGYGAFKIAELWYFKESLSSDELAEAYEALSDKYGLYPRVNIAVRSSSVRVPAEGKGFIYQEGLNVMAKVRYGGQTVTYTLNQPQSRKEGSDLVVEPIGSTLAIDFNSGQADNKRFVLTKNITGLTISATRAGWYTLLFEQDATGGRTVTWVTAIDGNLPPVDPAPNSKTVYRLYYDGTTFIF